MQLPERGVPKPRYWAYGRPDQPAGAPCRLLRYLKSALPEARFRLEERRCFA